MKSRVFMEGVLVMMASGALKQLKFVEELEWKSREEQVIVVKARCDGAFR